MEAHGCEAALKKYDHYSVKVRKSLISSHLMIHESVQWQMWVQWSWPPSVCEFCVNGGMSKCSGMGFMLL